MGLLGLCKEDSHWRDGTPVGCEWSRGAVLVHTDTQVPTFDKEGVMGVPGRVLLGLEEGIEVPEGALHKVVGGHLLESHFQENGAVLSPHLHQRVQVARGWGNPQGLEVVRLKRLALPTATACGKAM